VGEEYQIIHVDNIPGIAKSPPLGGFRREIKNDSKPRSSLSLPLRLPQVGEEYQIIHVDNIPGIA